MDEDGKVKINKFEGHHFGFWKMQIEDHLYQKKLHLPLSEHKPETMDLAEWNFMDRQDLGIVRSRDVTFNEDGLYKNDLAIAPSKSKQIQKVVFEELIDIDVLQAETGEGSQNSWSAEEIVNTKVNGSSKEDNNLEI